MVGKKSPRFVASEAVLKKAVAACRLGFVIVAVASLCINLLMLTVPIYMMQLFDRVLASRSTDTLLMLTVLAAAALLTLALLDMVRTVLLVRIGTWLEQRVSGAVLEASVVGILRSRHDPTIQGLRDLSTYRTFLSGPAIFPIMDSPWTPIFVAVIFLMHPLLGWIAISGAVVLFAFAITNELATRGPLRQAGSASIQSLERAEAAVRNADVIEAMGMLPNLINRWNRANAGTLTLQARAGSRSGGITAASKFVRLALQIGMLATGAWLVINAEVTPGVMIAASILLARALAPVEQAIGSWKTAVSARTAYQRVARQLRETPLRGEAIPLPTPKGQLTVKQAAYVHEGATEPLFTNVSFKLEPGELLGLVGPTASGKTTLARLLVGNLSPRAGHVRLDGAEVSRWPPEDLGRSIGYLPQDVELFSGTVGENIARMGEAEPDAVIAAAQLAGVHEMILSLPGGYETEIGPGGAALSGGQRQRIALARAVYGDPRFLVLDEPNASLDSDGEYGLHNALTTLRDRGATVVVITHRPGVLRQADKIVVLRGGRMERFGPADEVMAAIAGPQFLQPGAKASAAVSSGSKPE